MRQRFIHPTSEGEEGMSHAGGGFGGWKIIVKYSYGNVPRGILSMIDFFQTITASRKGLFWDKAPLDPEKDRFVIVERILEFGTEAEARTVVSCYGDEFVRDVVRNSRNLSPKTVNYFCWLLDIPREATKCFSDVSLRIWLPY
jgi:hypothetical protein